MQQHPTPLRTIAPILAMIFLSMIPVTMIVPVFKEIVKDRLGGSNFSVAWFQSIAMLGAFIFSPLAGYLSDRWGDRRSFIIFFAIVDGIIFSLLPKSNSINSLLALRFIEGSFHIFVVGLLFSVLSDYEKSQENTFFKKGLQFGLGGMLLTLGGGFGQALSFIGNKNPEYPFYLGSILFLLVSLIAFTYKKSFIQIQKSNNPQTRLLFSLPAILLIPVLFHFIDRFTVGYFLSSFNLHLRESMNYSPGETGRLFGTLFLLMGILSYPATLLSNRFGNLRLILIGSVLYGFGIILTIFFSSYREIFLIMVLCGIGAGLMYVPVLKFGSQLSPSGQNGLVMSGIFGAGSMGFFLGPLASVTIESFQLTDSGFKASAWIFGFLEIAPAIIVYFLWNHYVKVEVKMNRGES
jgi:MFS family permease